MKVTLVGMGTGAPETLTLEGREALLQADFIAGANRLLEALPKGCTENRGAATKSEKLMELLKGWENPYVVYSGDTGFYSGAKSLLPLLEEAGWETNLLPGISSVQVLAAKLLRPWQGWRLESAHGVGCDPVSALSWGRPVCFLTDGAKGPRELCAKLAWAGLGQLGAVVGENLSYPEEKIVTGTVDAFAERDFSPLNLLLVEPAPALWDPVSPGIPDSEFIRGGVPMTKQEVRAAALAKLCVRSTDTLWDVGAGTGSVAVEMALLAKKGRVFAIEREKSACEFIRKNREKFGAWGLHLVEGEAPNALTTLPAPDAVFVGGSGGKLREILEAVHEKNSQTRVCVTAITVETLSQAVKLLEGQGCAVEITQMAVSRSKKAGRPHMLLAENPVYIISARPGEAANG